MATSCLLSCTLKWLNLSSQWLSHNVFLRCSCINTMLIVWELKVKKDYKIKISIMSIWVNYRISEYLIHFMILADLLTINAGFFSFDLQALLIYLDKIFHPVVAVILSVTFVLAFGEVKYFFNPWFLSYSNILILTLKN